MRQGFKIQAPLDCVIVVLILGLSPSASASLGGDLQSVHQDMVHVNGSLRVTNVERYTIHEIRISTGTYVREFVSTEGFVFGVSWEGPIVPELQQFLGAHFQQYSVALHAEKSRFLSRRPLHIHLNDLVFENGGHVGAYSGRAYVPQALPLYVSITEIH